MENTNKLYSGNPGEVGYSDDDFKVDITTKRIITIFSFVTAFVSILLVKCYRAM